MPFHDAITDAIDHVLTWDMPDESLPAALSAEAGHLAGLDSADPAEVD
jgi:hypothetical protein